MGVFGISIVLLLFSGSLVAQKTLTITDSLELQIELIGPEQGLSQGMINEIVEDQEGFLWIATKDGLNRYDGSRFKVYRNDPDDLHSLSENFITSVYVDSRNQLWIGTNTSGLELFDREHERFIHIRIDQTNDLGYRIQNVQRILEDHSGHIIFYDMTGTKINTISLHKGGKNNSLSFSSGPELQELYPALKKLSLPLSGLNILCITKDGILWYAENKIVYGFEKSLKNATYRIDAMNIFIDPNTPPFSQTYLDNHESPQVLYFMDSKNYIFTLDIFTKTLLPTYVVPSIKISGYNRFFADTDKRIWIKEGARNFLRINSSKSSLDAINFNMINKEILEKLSFENFCQDRHKNIWCGTNGFGLLKINARNDLFINAPFKCNDQKFRFYFEGKKAILLSKFKNLDISFINRMNLEKDGLDCTWAPWTFAVDHQNFFWALASNENGAKYYTIKINPFHLSYEKKPIDYIGDIEDPIIFSDLHGEIWLNYIDYNRRTTRICHLHQKSGKIKNYFFPIEYIHNEHRFLSDWYVTADNQFWLATKQGLFLFDPKKENWKKYQNENNNNASLSSNSILSLCPDPEEPSRYLWVGTEGGGLNRFDIKEERFERFSTKDGLPNNVIYGIQSDKRNNLWISTNSGLCFFNPHTLEMQTFTSKDGLPGNEFNRYQYSKSDEGILYFGGVNGWVCFDPENYYKNKRQSDVVINKLKILNKEVIYGLTDTIKLKDNYHLPAPIERCTKLIFNYDQRMITFGFTTLDFTNPEGNRYKYKMEGFNNDWIDAGTNNEATYTNLSPGNYVFKVLGSNSMNVWSQAPAIIDIEILPPWWKTWWFQLSIILSFVSGLKLQTLRNQISADLHDEIGSTLSSISLASSMVLKKIKGKETEVLSLLKIINSNSYNILEAISDIVWAVNARNDRFDNVINRIRSLAFETLEPLNVNIHFNIYSEISQLSLNMQQRKNLYLIVKEAINNVAKYADCKNVWLAFEYQNGRLSVKVKDDGRGFETKCKEHKMSFSDEDENYSNQFGGNGLYNMQKRANDLNGQIKICSIPDQGTEIELEFKV